MSCIRTHAVIQVSFVLRTYSSTEGGSGVQSVEVCLQIVAGTIDSSVSGATVNVWTISQTAIGNNNHYDPL